MGELRYGPGGLPEAPTFEAAFAALRADGYRACEFGFVGGFWLDYETAPHLGEAAGADARADREHVDQREQGGRRMRGDVPVLVQEEDDEGGEHKRRALAGEAKFGNAPIHRETVAKSLLA